MIHVSFDSNIPEIKAAFDNACKRGLMACGSTAEGYAVGGCPVDTGALRNSINYAMDGDNTVAIGTNMEYAAYVELGTGQYCTLGGGRSTPWVYQDWRGDWHYTNGSPAQPYLKPAIADHGQEYTDIIKDSLVNA